MLLDLDRVTGMGYVGYEPDIRVWAYTVLYRASSYGRTVLFPVCAHRA